MTEAMNRSTINWKQINLNHKNLRYKSRSELKFVIPIRKMGFASSPHSFPERDVVDCWLQPAYLVLYQGGGGSEASCLKLHCGSTRSCPSSRHEKRLQVPHSGGYNN